MPLGDQEIDNAQRRARAIRALLERAENATDFLELKSVVLELCRVVNVQVEAEHFPSMTRAAPRSHLLERLIER
jgi:hypothetical protein